MDPVLPFRPLSPGTRNPKFSHRAKDSKLSLKSLKGALVRQGNKENVALLSTRTKDLGEYQWRLEDSDLMTSDESDSSIPGTRHDERKNSVMSLNTRDSTFSLPVAESTRCDHPASQMTGQAESTVATLHTANRSFSSNSTEFFTAFPLSIPCDDSIVCITDSSPEPARRTVSKLKGHAESILISSDESDDECGRKISHFSLSHRLSKKEEKKLCDTVILETSLSDADDDKNLVISPSIGSYNGSSNGSSVITDNAMLDKLPDVVIPPTPEGYSESIENDETSLISDESYVERQGGTLSPSKNPPVSKEANSLKETKALKSTELDFNESSWKEDFHLVMPESSISSEEQCKSKAEATEKTVRHPISKEKYDDIARWLICGRESSESISDDPNTRTSPAKPLVKIPQGLKTSKHRQVSRLSIVRKSSFGSESDDNFNALIESVRKKRTEKQVTKIVKDDSFINDDSFIDDSCASDVVGSSLLNVYHSDLTKSIKAEVKSVKKSVKSMKKRQIFRCLYSSDEISDVEKSRTPVTKLEKPTFKSLRKYNTYGSDSDDSEVANQRKDKKSVSSSGSDDERPDEILSGNSTPFCGNQRKDKTTVCSDGSGLDKGKEKANLPASSVIRRVPGRTVITNTKSADSSAEYSSDCSSSGSDGPVNSKVSDWRHTGHPSSSSSDGSFSAPPKLNKPPSKPKKISKKVPLKVPAKTISSVTPKAVAALKSPNVLYSPIRTFLSSLSGPTHDPGIRDHPEAAVYNKSFKTKKEELTRRLYKLFNREVFDKRLPDDMLLEWNARLVRTAGLCYCKIVRKDGVTTRSAKIALSTKVITSPDRLRDTLIHEMCHAAVWLLNNVSGGHGPFWKAWAQKAMRRFTELPPIERCHSYNIETKYTYKCTKCGYSFGRHSKSLDLNKKRCGHCYGTFEVFLSSQGQINQDKQKTPKAPSAFALFVKENYGLLKQTNAHLKHGDIMKKLGEKFSSMKVKQ